MRILMVSLLSLLLLSCRYDGSDIEGKWQLHEVRAQNGRGVVVDSVFLNFMNGVCTAICLGPNGEYADFYGRYIYTNDALTVYVLKPTSLRYDWDRLPNNPIAQENSSQRYVVWPNQEKEFQVQTVTSSRMELISGDSTYLFRKY